MYGEVSAKSGKDIHMIFAAAVKQAEGTAKSIASEVKKPNSCSMM